jgi:hypothetical protein
MARRNICARILQRCGAVFILFPLATWEAQLGAAVGQLSPGRAVLVRFFQFPVAERFQKLRQEIAMTTKVR